MEKWKNFMNGVYQVSNLGRVRKIYGYETPRLLKQSSTNDGYKCIGTWFRGVSKRYLVSSLVAEAFIGPRPLGYEVNHKDLNKSNDRWDNLEYLTHQDNIRHAVENGHTPPGSNYSGENNPKARLTRKQVDKIRDLYSAGKYTQASLGRRFGVSRQLINDVVKFKTWNK